MQKNVFILSFAKCCTQSHWGWSKVSLILHPIAAFASPFPNHSISAGNNIDQWSHVELIWQHLKHKSRCYTCMEASMMWIEYYSSSEPNSVLVTSDFLEYFDVLGNFFWMHFFFFFWACSNCAVRQSLVLDEVAVLGEVGPRMKAGVWCYPRGLSERQVLGNSELLELLLCSVGCTLRWTCRAMTLESQRTWSTVLSAIFSFYNSYHFFSAMP